MNAATLQPAELGRLLQGRTAQRAILVINLLLVVWIASRLAILTWGLLPQKEAPAPTPVVAAKGNVPAKPDPDLVLIRQLPGWHLMGEVNTAAEQPVKVAAPVEAPDTSLNLTLKGVLAADVKEDARAIIADQRGQDEHYAIGGTLPGNVELSAIYPDRVILLRNGRYETLRLPTDDKPRGGNVYSAATAPTARSPQSASQRLQAIRSQIKQQPASLAGMLQVAPYNDAEGKLAGYTVAPGRDPQLFEQVGLRTGDVVTEVNGLALTDPENSAMALQSLQSGEPVTLRLLRDGVEQTLSIDGSQ
ncbi:MAG: type II secretion system protein GspC [Pseudomonadota bacterium]